MEKQCYYIRICLENVYMLSNLIKKPKKIGLVVVACLLFKLKFLYLKITGQRRGNMRCMLGTVVEGRQHWWWECP